MLVGQIPVPLALVVFASVTWIDHAILLIENDVVAHQLACDGEDVGMPGQFEEAGIVRQHGA